MKYFNCEPLTALTAPQLGDSPLPVTRVGLLVQTDSNLDHQVHNIQLSLCKLID